MDLARETAQRRPDTLILSCPHLGTCLRSEAELGRLKALLTSFSDDIRIIAHVDEPAALLTRHYAEQILEGRGLSLDAELTLAKADNWCEAALVATPVISPAKGAFAETQAPAFWLDYPALVSRWEDVFGTGSVQLRPYGAALFASTNVMQELRAAFGIDVAIGKAEPATLPDEPSAASLARGRQLNALILQVLAQGKRILPRQLWRTLVQEVAVDGPPLDPGNLHAISKQLEPGNKALLKSQPALHADTFKRPRAKGPWTEADPLFGYRASQYLLSFSQHLLSFMWRINKASRQVRRAKGPALAQLAGTLPAPEAQPDGLSDDARALMPPLAIQNFEKLRTSSFAPHNRLDAVNEEELAAAHSEIKPRKLPKGSTGNVIVGCMKNEAPYIVEWIAYHRAIGFDDFLVFSNDCYDGTDIMLDHLSGLGVLTHIRNDGSYDKGGIQFIALKATAKLPQLATADWILPLDIDEFVNIHTGDHTLPALHAAIPDSTAITLTWRLFGAGSQVRYQDSPVTDTFNCCAPSVMHWPWRAAMFKTLYRNNSIYAKPGVHRPRSPDQNRLSKARWFDGNGTPLPELFKTKRLFSNFGRDNYGLVQLNHYPLGALESYIVKADRGRAVHSEHLMGMVYWVERNFNTDTDTSIAALKPARDAELDRFTADATLAGLHEKAVTWRKDRFDVLMQQEPFRAFFGRLLIAPESKPVPLRAAQFMTRYVNLARKTAEK